MTSMIVHGHGDIWYVHYDLDMYPSNSNNSVDTLAEVLRDLEDVPKFASRQIFPNTHVSPLCNALLEGSNICKLVLLLS
jgi:hypothetical protein